MYKANRAPARKERPGEEWNEVMKKAAYYSELAKEYRTDKASVSFNDITGNLGLNLASRFKRNDTPLEVFNLLKQSVDDARRYFSLLEDFPDFKNKELNTEKGFFPDLHSQILNAHELVDAYEAALRGTKVNE